MSERITIQDIENKQFSIKPRGYDRDEVDAYLDEICDEMERLENEKAALRRQLQEAQAAGAAPAPAAPQPVRTAPAAAASTANAASNAELINVLELANRLKDETVAEAKKKAEEILSEADSQARQRLGNLAEEKDRLEGQVEALKKTAADYRSRFAELVKAQQDALDKIADL